MTLSPLTPEFRTSAVAGSLPADAPSAARSAYDALGADYDALTADHDYERWLSVLEALARRHGLAGRRLLDLACGTGRSFEPMLRRGYDVTACDVSPEMVRLARRRAPGVPVAVADMRALPEWGPFDLVTCLDDAVNYLPGERDLDAAFAGVARVLRPGGVFVFDLNSLLTYRTAFTSTFSVDAGDVQFTVRGDAPPDVAPGAACPSRIEIRTRGPHGGWHRRVSEHDQRHWPPDTVCSHLRAAGLDPVALHGQTTGCVLHDTVDETARDTKVILVARRD
jgi:SAM-dependent methyltransferase